MTSLEIKSKVIANTCFAAFTQWAASTSYRELHRAVFGSYPEDDPLNGQRTVKQIMHKVNLYNDARNNP